MTKDEEIQDAYNKLDAAEMQIARMKKQANMRIVRRHTRRPTLRICTSGL